MELKISLANQSINALSLWTVQIVLDRCKMFWSSTNSLGRVQIILIRFKLDFPGLIFHNIDLSKMIWARPKLFGLFKIILTLQFYALANHSNSNSHTIKVKQIYLICIWWKILTLKRRLQRNYILFRYSGQKATPDQNQSARNVLHCLFLVFMIFTYSEFWQFTRQFHKKKHSDTHHSST